MSVDDLAQLYRDVNDRSSHCPVVTDLTLSVVLPGAVPEPLREDSEGCGDVLEPKWAESRVDGCCIA